jgi:hypothetical protein
MWTMTSSRIGRSGICTHQLSLRLICHNERIIRVLHHRSMVFIRHMLQNALLELILMLDYMIWPGRGGDKAITKMISYSAARAAVPS